MTSLDTHDITQVIGYVPIQPMFAGHVIGIRDGHVIGTRINEGFAELEQYGVRHEDAQVRNITYDQRQGRFCIIDFEFATILLPGYPPSPKMESHPNREAYRDALE